MIKCGWLGMLLRGSFEKVHGPFETDIQSLLSTSNNTLC